jgi:hypothetical protein
MSMYLIIVLPFRGCGVLSHCPITPVRKALAGGIPVSESIEIDAE